VPAMKEGGLYFKCYRSVVSGIKELKIEQHILPYIMGKMKDPYFIES